MKNNRRKAVWGSRVALAMALSAAALASGCGDVARQGEGSSYLIVQALEAASGAEPDEFEGVLFSPGEQISYQFGVGFSVNDRVTLSAALLGFYITNIQMDNETVEGTNLEPLSLRFAATIARNCRILEPYAMIGMTEAAPAFNIGIVVTFY